MRELGRVVANEWMKLMRRRRLWIAVLLAGLVVCAWSAHSYKNYLHLVEWDLPEKLQLRIEQAEQVGETELKVKLEEMLAEETEHKEELERLLEDPRL